MLVINYVHVRIRVHEMNKHNYNIDDKNNQDEIA